MTTNQFGIKHLKQIRDFSLLAATPDWRILMFFNSPATALQKASMAISGYSHTEKTETPTRIPLLPLSQTIIDKYKNHPRCVNRNTVLQVLSNQKMNSFLKEIADACGITKTLTFHIARHTFATTVTLNNDVPIESGSKMLGHKSIKITQHYAKIIDKKVSSDMTLLAEKMKLKIVKK